MCQVACTPVQLLVLLAPEGEHAREQHVQQHARGPDVADLAMVPVVDQHLPTCSACKRSAAESGGSTTCLFCCINLHTSLMQLVMHVESEQGVPCAPRGQCTLAFRTASCTGSHSASQGASQIGKEHECASAQHHHFDARVVTQSLPRRGLQGGAAQIFTTGCQKGSTNQLVLGVAEVAQLELHVLRVGVALQQRILQLQTNTAAGRSAAFRIGR